MASFTPADVWPTEAPGAEENDALRGLVQEDLPGGWSRRTMKTGASLFLCFNDSFCVFPYFLCYQIPEQKEMASANICSLQANTG